ncbi:hypothetical protein [Falsiroseomonas sp. HW251]|uniref:hypothetical protein n=1 Tax=Falsiroseomonas sp. HW251 TaxID=3390998 RepID=UPI003D314A38
MATITAYDRLARGLDMSDVSATGWIETDPNAPAPDAILLRDNGSRALFAVDLDPASFLQIDYIAGSGFITLRNLTALDRTFNFVLVIDGANITTSFGEIEQGLSSFNFLTGNDLVAGNRFSDLLRGGPGNDTLFGNGGGDRLLGDAGDDRMDGGGGSDVLDGGEGTDTAVLSGPLFGLQAAANGGRVLVLGPDGADVLINVEFVTLAGGFTTLALASFLSQVGTFTPTFARTDLATNASSTVIATSYSGPVDYLALQYLGSSAGEAVVGTAFSDFINAIGGDDAVDAGAGWDVLDGGIGSNFLTGGADRDVFFLDGRSGLATWSTITDWEVGEQLSVWGWRPGVSRVLWVDFDGVAGYRGVTMHADLDGNGVIDTSVTWAAQTRSSIPTPLEFDGLLWFL